MTGNNSPVAGKIKAEKKRSSIAEIFKRKTPSDAQLRKKSTSDSSLNQDAEHKRRSVVSRLTSLVGRQKSDEKSIAHNKAEAIMHKAAIEEVLKYKVLLLGAGECGKSTILKQIKVVHDIHFNEEEMKAFGVNLRRNTIQSMQVLIDACEYMVPPIDIQGDPLLKLYTDTVRDFDCADDDAEIPENIYKAVMSCWNSDQIQAAWLRRDEYWCLDSIEYYFENFSRFIDADFVPNSEDCVMARIITTGIVSTHIERAPRAFEVIDVGGQRNERRKWMECFTNVNCLMYVVNLAGYATVTYEDASINRMTEAMDTFKATVNNRVFNNTKICLIFNKKDAFEDMLLKRPLHETFKDYEGSNSPEECMEYIEGRFRALLNDMPERLTTHHIAARNKEDVRDLWETIAARLRDDNVEEANKAVSKLQKLEKAEQKAASPKPAKKNTDSVLSDGNDSEGNKVGTKKMLSLTPEETQSETTMAKEGAVCAGGDQ